MSTNEEIVIGLIKGAKEYFDLGIQCFPVYRWFDREKKKHMMYGAPDSSYSGWSCEHTYESFIERIKSLNSAGKIPNGIAVRTGPESNVTVLDSDSETSEKYIHRYPFKEGAVVKTSRGLHRYYRYNTGTSTFRGKGLQEGIDVRARGGLAIVPPTPGYSWVVPLVSTNALPEFPPELQGMLFGVPRPIRDRVKQIKQYIKKIKIGEAKIKGSFKIKK